MGFSKPIKDWRRLSRHYKILNKFSYDFISTPLNKNILIEGSVDATGRYLGIAGRAL